MNFKSIEEAKSNIIKSSLAIVSLKENIKDYEKLITSADEYIKENLITESDIVPGAIFEYGAGTINNELYAIVYNLNTGLYFLGGVTGNPSHLFIQPPTGESKEKIVKTLNSFPVIKRADLKVDFTKV